MVGLGCFLSSPPKLNLPKENESENGLQIFGLKCPHPTANMMVFLLLFLIFAIVYFNFSKILSTLATLTTLILLIFFFGKLLITPLKFGCDWILHPEISEFGFYPLKFEVFGFYTLTFQNLNFIP